VTLVLWPIGWMDQDETWHAGRPRPWPHCVRWRARCPSPKRHSSQFSAHICCGQTARWIKIPLGETVGLDPRDIVLDGDPAPSPTKGDRAPLIFGPCLLCPNSCIDQDATWYGGRSRPKRHYVRRGSSSPLPKKGQSPHFRPMSIVVKRPHGSRCHLVWR